MKYVLQQNLGLDDVRFCNKELGTDLPTDSKALEAGSVVELTDAAVAYLANTKGYVSLLQPAKITGESKKPEITAPAK